MQRAGKWISAVTVGLALACEASPAFSQAISSTDEPAIGRWTTVNDQDDQSEAPATDDQDTTAVDRDAVNTDSASDEDAQTDPQAMDPVQTEDSDTPDRSDAETIKERFPDGTIRIERQVTQDAQGNYVNHGPWKMWDARGNVVAQGDYEHGNRVGTWVRWYRNVAEAPLLAQSPYQLFTGPIVSQATFEHGELSGTWTIFDAKMHKISQWQFTDGKRSGKSIWWYPSGRKLREIDYRDGDIDGAVVEWSADGKAIVNDTYEGSRKLAQKSAKYADGKKKSEGMYLFAKVVEQTPDDWWNCKVLTTTQTGKDEKHGAWTAWHPNGQRQLEAKYEHDLQVGKFTWWHANGQKALEGQFEGGKQNGPWTWWYPNGQKSIHGQYAHGNPTGRWTWWKEDGKVAQSADLSQSEGVVIETPHNPEKAPTLRTARPNPARALNR